jgi:ATP-dependent Clp protease ATP-binding subunit ClpC
MEVSLNLHSPRAHKARYARRLHGKVMQTSLLIVGLCSLAASVFLLVENSSAGFLTLLPGVLCFITWMWYKGELQNLKVDGSHTVDAVLDASTLARLTTANPSAHDVWKALEKSRARYFFQNRYMLPMQILEEFLGKEAGSAQAVWSQAELLQQKYHSDGYENAVVIVALLKSIPNAEQLLRQLQLELQDIEAGIEWTEDIKQKRKLAAEKHSFGGMARDWAYGYTPLLRYLGHNMSEQIQMYGFFQDTRVHQQVVDQMLQAMGSGSSTVTLVGDIGVGKTTCAYAFAERLLDDKSVAKKLRYSQVVALDAPALLAQVKGPGELESLVIRLLNEAHKAKNIILFFDDAHVFFSNGPSSVDLSNVLQPALDSGSVRLIFAMTPREWQQISGTNGSVASKLQAVQVREPDETETIHVLRDQILTIEYQRKVVFTYQALREAYRLGSRYIDSQVMPGAALSVLTGAASIAKDGYVTDAIVKQSIESSVGVKLQEVNHDETQTLLHLEDELHKYVINQKRAVSVIANALRRSRSGVGNPDRPIGTFLFLGPTGVGKTELSKALARVYFGNVDSIVRVDMNQYVQPSDVNRLITPMLGDQLGFLGQVRRQPFSVILLDEIEKAHPNVVNLLLQMLDEGVMRDIDHKAVSFKDAIIIATSNAGADEIRRIIDEGGDVNEHEAEFVEHLISRGSFAPEFLNRFDEIVLFRPLNQDELVQVIDLIIAGINKTLDSQKIQVVLTDPAKRWLVDKGYDSRLGARPMRRMAQRYVENILAKRLLDHSAVAGGQVHLDVPDFEQLDEQAQ